MAVGSYFTTASPQAVAGLVVQSETRVRIGLYSLYNGSLETTSAVYISHNAPVGLVAGNSIDLGELASLGFEHVPSFEAPDVANVLTSSLEVLAEEETTITIGIMQFDARVLNALIRTGVLYTVGSSGNERLITAGGSCAAGNRRPIEISATNIGCNAPAAVTSVLTALSAIVITVYDAGCTSGLPWSDIMAKEINVLDTEWKAYPVSTHALGNKLFNVLLF